MYVQRVRELFAITIKATKISHNGNIIPTYFSESYNDRCSFGGLVRGSEQNSPSDASHRLLICVRRPKIFKNDPQELPRLTV